MSYNYVDACRLPGEEHNKSLMRIGQRPFPAGRCSFQELVDSLGRSRLESYLSHARGQDDLAIRLYAWNARLADALRFSLEIAEIAFSHVMDRALTERFSEKWYNNSLFLDKLDNKKREHFLLYYLKTKEGRIRRKSEVIENIPFGFWKHLFSDNFISHLWVWRIERFFTNKNNLCEMELASFIKEKLIFLIDIRNKIAHNCPIWTPTSPTEIEKEIYKFVELYSKEARSFISHHSYISDIVRCKPSYAPERSIEFNSVSFNKIFSCQDDVLTAIKYMKENNIDFIIVNSDAFGERRNFILNKKDIYEFFMDNLDTSLGIIEVCGKIFTLKDKFSQIYLNKDLLPEASLREIFKRNKENFNYVFILEEDFSNKNQCRVFNILEIINSEKIWVPIAC